MNFTDSLVPVILIADDELIVRNVAAAMLAGQGYIVLTAEDGFEAADLIEDFQGVINLVFCDMRMPGPSGMELRERILSRRPATKVVLLSGDTAFVGVPPDVVTFPKPFSSAQFRTFVRKMLNLRDPAISGQASVRRTVLSGSGSAVMGLNPANKDVDPQFAGIPDPSKPY